MEAPEKIYVQLPSGKWIGRTWNETPIKEGDNPNWKNATNFEYTRTDVIVEKACEWLRENKDKYLYNTGGKDEYIPTCSNKIIDDFRNYIKGK